MVKFTYIPRDGDPLNTVMMRVLFEGGKPVEIDETSEIGNILVHKLRNNPWFHEGDDPPRVVEESAKKAADLREQARQLWAQAHALDPEGTANDRTPPKYVVSLKQRKLPTKDGEYGAGQAEG